MTRFVFLFLFNIHWTIILYVSIMRTVKRNAPLEERYKAVKRAMTVINKKSRVDLETEGLEELPEKDGFILFANHQGIYDGVGLLTSSERPISFALTSKRMNVFPIKAVFKALDAKPVDLSNTRTTYKSFKEIEEAIAEGRNYVIFPEGYYDNEKQNTMYKFHTGCMHIPIETHCPVVPVCLYDTYKPYNSKGLKRVKCKVIYLKPIFYEEYQGLKPPGLAQLVKSRIEAALEELSAAAAE